LPRCDGARPDREPQAHWLLAADAFASFGPKSVGSQVNSRAICALIGYRRCGNMPIIKAIAIAYDDNKRLKGPNAKEERAMKRPRLGGKTEHRRIGLAVR
jgi:hypothetical protein